MKRLAQMLRFRPRPMPAAEPELEAARPDFAVPVLCYHSWTVNGDGYGKNDHLALEGDLAELSRRGYRILPLSALAQVLRGELPAAALSGHKLVGISFDDGWDLDYADWDSERWGRVKSFHRILSESGLPKFCDGPMAVSFVIASPAARATLAKTCGNGPGDWGEHWWAECAAGDVIGIANHGWDHLHESVETVRQRDNRKGSFLAVDNFDDAEGQIADAHRHIAAVTGGRQLPLFGYPYGHVPDYLRDDYFPQHGERIGVRAAFGTTGTWVDGKANVWAIPRLVFGWHWNSPQAFAALLDRVERRLRPA